MASQKTCEDLLVVLGATGSQGGAVLRHFISQTDSQIRLRGITRKPESAASESLIESGVEMVAADLDDIDSLQRAFTGATHIFANTDSNRIMFDALEHPGKRSSGQSPADYATVIEKRHGMNVVEAAASTSTLKRIVWSGLASPRKWSHGRYTKVAMFDVKEEIAELFKARAELNNKFSTVLIGFYADDALKLPAVFAPKKVSDGRYELAIRMSKDLAVPMANVEADLGSWVGALFQAEPGVVLIGASEYLTWPQWLQLWGQHNHVQTSYREVSAEEFVPDLGELREAVIEEFEFIQDFGFAGEIKNVIYPQQLRASGISILTTPIDQSIQVLDWSEIL